MIKRRHLAIAAGVVYLVLAALMAVVLARWVIAGVPEAISFARAHPQFIHTFLGVPALAAVSITLGVVLLRKGPSRSVVVLSFVGAALGALLGWVGVAFWLIPVPFVVGGYRTQS